MRLDITSESRMVDIVAEGYDAGIRLAESVPQDMIAVELTGDIRMLVVATPDYFAEHGIPQSPEDLLRHKSVGMRMSHGGFTIGNWNATNRNFESTYRRALY